MADLGLAVIQGYDELAIFLKGNIIKILHKRKLFVCILFKGYKYWFYIYWNIYLTILFFKIIFLLKIGVKQTTKIRQRSRHKVQKKIKALSET